MKWPVRSTCERGSGWLPASVLSRWTTLGVPSKSWMSRRCTIRPWTAFSATRSANRWDYHCPELPQVFFLSQQKFCHDKRVFKHVFSREKCMLAAAKLLSWRLCLSFVTTKIFCRKISCKTAVKSGALEISDIRKYISAQKIMWIRKLKQTKHKWKNIALVTYPFIIGLEQCGPNLYSQKSFILGTCF